MKVLTLIIAFVVFFVAEALATEPTLWLVKADPGVDLQAWCNNLSGPDYYCTYVVSGHGGSMVWVAGPTAPTLESGMVIWGSRYDVIFQDKDIVNVYNDIYPPDQYGIMRPFVALYGREREMGLW